MLVASLLEEKGLGELICYLVFVSLWVATALVFYDSTSRHIEKKYIYIYIFFFPKEENIFCGKGDIKERCILRQSDKELNFETFQIIMMVTVGAHLPCVQTASESISVCLGAFNPHDTSRTPHSLPSSVTRGHVCPPRILGSLAQQGNFGTSKEGIPMGVFGLLCYFHQGWV